MFSTYPYPKDVGINPGPVPDANLGPTNKVTIPGALFGTAQGEYINGSFDDKEHAPDMGPAVTPVPAYMTSGTKKMYYKGELIRFQKRGPGGWSRARQISQNAPHPFADFVTPETILSDNKTTFVAPLAETQELVPNTSQFVAVAVYGNGQILVPRESDSFEVFPGDRLFIETSPSLKITTKETPFEAGIVMHYCKHRNGDQTIVRVYFK